MSQLLNLPQGVFSTKLSAHDHSKLLQQKMYSFSSMPAECYKYHGFQSSMPGSLGLVDNKKRLLKSETYVCREKNLEVFPHVQTLREFPLEELAAKVVMVRFDSTILLQEKPEQRTQSITNAVFTIKYLCTTGARVILVSDWSIKNRSKHLVAEYVADSLSSLLQLKVLHVKPISYDMSSIMEGFKKADILLLENLSKILASTVGVARFCSACLAGFHFEESLLHLKKASETKRKPYVAIMGGGNLFDKAAALHFLASTCDALVFVGMMSFPIMHALGLPVPSHLVERRTLPEALEIIQLAFDRNLQVIYPEDFWCMDDSLPKQMKIFSAHNIPDGWAPADLGPLSLDKIDSLLKKCQKIMWIGPVKFSVSSAYTNGASKLAKMLDQLSRSDCEITVVGNMACKAIIQESSSVSVYHMLENASVVWEFLKGRKLPGVLALDRAYPYYIDWNAVYRDPAQPLVVDIGSGNGMFLLEMARRNKYMNFLGIEINEKLVSRCLNSISQMGMKNGYFIATNATSTFRSIVSSYPGELVLVSIQCPNPGFNKPEHRWRMLQRSLVEAIADLLSSHGKVFLQSDIETVAVRMKEDFLKYGKGKLAIMHDKSDIKTDQGEWLDENPFGVRSDWERHVIDRGAPMFRLMLSKSTESG